MADEPIAQTYVYALFREDGVTPFYIGIGRGGRWLVHEKSAYRFTARKDRIIQKMQREGFSTIPKAKLLEGLTRPEAAAIEADLVHLIGRFPIGPLANYTKGGEGVSDPSPESREKKANANRLSWADPIVRQKRLDAIRAAWTPEARERHGKLMASREDDWKKKVSDRRKEEFFKKNGRGPKQRPPDNRSAYMKAAWQDPVIREKRLAGLAKGRVSLATPEARENKRAALKKFWSNPENREKQIKAMQKGVRPEGMLERLRTAMASSKVRENIRKALADPVRKEKMKAAQRAAFARPEERARRSAASKAMWEKRKHQKTLPLENE